MSRRKAAVPLRAVCILGTLAHNRSFSVREFREYYRESVNRGQAPAVNPDRLFRALRRRGVITKRGSGYYPTSKGWNAIERSCRIASNRRRR